MTRTKGEATTAAGVAFGLLAARLEPALQGALGNADESVELASWTARACRRAAALAIPRDHAAELVRMAEAFEAAANDAELPRSLAERAIARLSEWQTPESAEEVLERSATSLAGVGPKRARSLEARGLGTLGALLFHLPIRYDDRRALERIGDLQAGQRATVLGTIESAGESNAPVRGRFRRVLRAVLRDESGSVGLKWFRVSDGLVASLQPGATVLATGDVKRYRFDLEIVHPEIEIVARATARKEGEDEAPLDPVALDAHQQIVPHYATPDGVPPRTFRGWVASAVAETRDLVEGHLPERIVRERGLPSPSEALRSVHEPDPDADPVELGQRRSPAHERLILEELYLLTLGLCLRQARGRERAAHVLDAPSDALEALLPFELTGAQRRSWDEIRADLARPVAMHRLLQGDVGSGKTAVAFLSAMAALRSGKQAVFMAPTELLAEQHARTLSAFLADLPAGERPACELLTASRPKPEAQEIRRALEDGRLPLAVGTHALLAGDLRMPGLGLAIVDEQHRFGVRQRAALAALAGPGAHPHVLVMTATPIPRTLALTVYGDLDVSVIDELPPGRTPVETSLVRAGEGREVMRHVRETADRGEQIYVVYPLVEESEKIDLRSATEQTEKIRAAFPDLRVDLVHGRQSAEERAAAMARFASGETRILVATTVIEVGVDVPNATLIVVEHAERFGLAQLHQLRGRVGRGQRPGTCLLVSRGGGRDSEERLRAMLETTDGFAIADADLRIRGPGEFLGTRQSGHLPELRIADLVRDGRLVSVAREAAHATVRSDPGLGAQPELLRAVERRWGDRLALADVG